MKRPLKVYPIGGESPTDWVSGWNDTHSDSPLLVIDTPEQCQVYLACDVAADVIDEEIQDRRLPNRPVIWPPLVYASCGDFGLENSTCYDHLLHTLHGVVAREELIDTLCEVREALYKASSVVSSNEDEVYACQPELDRLHHLLEQLKRGAFITEQGAKDFSDVHDLPFAEVLPDPDDSPQTVNITFSPMPAPKPTGGFIEIGEYDGRAYAFENSVELLAGSDGRVYAMIAERLSDLPDLDEAGHPLRCNEPAEPGGAR